MITIPWSQPDLYHPAGGIWTRLKYSSFIWETCIKYLICARHCTKLWGSKTNKTQSLPSEDLHRDSKSTPYLHERFCTGYVLDFWPRVATLAIQIVFCTENMMLMSAPWVVYCTVSHGSRVCPTYSSSKIPSLATLPSNSFQMHLWSEFSPSLHPLLTATPKAQPPRRSSVLGPPLHILSAVEPEN